MKPFKRTVWIAAAASVAAILSTVVIVHAVRAAGGMQEHGHMMSNAGGMPDVAQEQGRDMMHDMTAPQDGSVDRRHGAMPTSPGQDAFGAIQEIVGILEADPTTDWSKVNLEALRQHLIDMNEVTLKADARQKTIEGGLQIDVTGSGRTLAAIQRMVPDHAREVERTHLNGWSAKTAPLPNGVRLTVTSADAKEVAHIRGLGFIGIMVSGHHHQPHHLAMAKGQMPY